MAHSIIGPSASKRILSCPGSVQLTQSLPPAVTSRSSIYAAEGTLAHELSERVLNGEDIDSFRGQTFEVEGYAFTPDDEFFEHVLTYVQYVNGMRAVGFDVKLETRVSIDDILPDDFPVSGFGTADCIATMVQGNELKRLIVADLKFGRGVTVEVEDNEQLKYYGVGAVLSLPSDLQMSRDTPVTLSIIQPRKEHEDGVARSQELTLGELMDWAGDVLAPSLTKAILDKDAPRKPGSHCMFCPAAGVCPEKRQTIEDELDAMPLDHLANGMAGLDTKALAQALSKAAEAEKWAEAVRAFAQTHLEAGGDIPGWKLVEKRAYRKWNHDESHVRGTIEGELGVEGSELWDKPSILSPSAMETKLKKLGCRQPDIDQVMSTLIIKQSSGTTLAPAEDKRPAVAGRLSAAEVFANTPD
jgi:Protein of unknown function (DUF2800)